MGNCPECDSFRWFPGSGDRLYKVPGLNQGNLPIVEVSHERHSLVRNLEKPRKVRLPGAIRYYRGAVPEKRKQSKIPSHIEELLGMDKKPEGRAREHGTSDWNTSGRSLGNSVCKQHNS